MLAGVPADPNHAQLNANQPETAVRPDRRFLRFCGHPFKTMSGKSIRPFSQESPEVPKNRALPKIRRNKWTFQMVFPFKSSNGKTIRDLPLILWLGVRELGLQPLTRGTQQLTLSGCLEPAPPAPSTDSKIIQPAKSKKLRSEIPAVPELSPGLNRRPKPEAANIYLNAYIDQNPKT